MKPNDRIDYRVLVEVQCDDGADEVSKCIVAILTAALGGDPTEMRRAESELRAVIGERERAAGHGERVRCYTAIRQVLDARPVETVDRALAAQIIERIIGEHPRSGQHEVRRRSDALRGMRRSRVARAVLTGSPLKYRHYRCDTCGKPQLTVGDWLVHHRRGTERYDYAGTEYRVACAGSGQWIGAEDRGVFASTARRGEG